MRKPDQGSGRREQRCGATRTDRIWSAARLLFHRLRGRLPADAKPAVEELDDILRQSIGELRTVSSLLHALVLDEGGLAIALRNYIDGFAECSHIRVELELADEMERLPANTELALLRVVQEALTNVYRDSASTVAKIRILESESSLGRSVMLSIEDEGPDTQVAASTIPHEGKPNPLRDLGLSRMRERMDQVGDRLGPFGSARNRRSRDPSCEGGIAPLMLLCDRRLNYGFRFVGVTLVVAIPVVAWHRLAGRSSDVVQTE